jgi:hypothetical protein
MRQTLPRAVLLTSLLLSGPALGDLFGASPYHFGFLVNEALKQVGSKIRLHRNSCTESSSLECRFSSGRIIVLVQGQTHPPQTSRVAIEADLMQDEAGDSPIQMVADCVLMLGATMVVVDPQLPAVRRVQLLSDLIIEVLDTGSSENEGVNARYTLVFDEAASGMLNIMVTPLTSSTGDNLVDRGLRKSGTATPRHWSHP